MKTRACEVAGRSIGGGPALIVAEAGVNHNGRLDFAERLVEVASSAGCDAVKFQTFEPELLAAPTAGTAEYQREAAGDHATQLDMLRSLALSHEAHGHLKRCAEALGLLFLSTPFDEPSADFLDALGVPAFKISSGDLTNLPFLRHVARKGRPMLLSTGMSTLTESLQAVEAVEHEGVDQIGLFHCVSSYPTPAEDCNLLAMGTLRAASGRPTGWSDHTEGIDLAVAAVALGAELIEKHFTLDRSLPGPDHRASLEPRELEALVRSVRRVEAALGDGKKVPRPIEVPIAAIGRRSLCYRASLPAGTLVAANHLIALRPGTGLAPAGESAVLGRRLARGVSGGDLIRMDDFVDAT